MRVVNVDNIYKIELSDKTYHKWVNGKEAEYKSESSAEEELKFVKTISELRGERVSPFKAIYEKEHKWYVLYYQCYSGSYYDTKEEILEHIRSQEKINKSVRTTKNYYRANPRDKKTILNRKYSHD